MKAHLLGPVNKSKATRLSGSYTAGRRNEPRNASPGWWCGVPVSQRWVFLGGRNNCEQTFPRRRKHGGATRPYATPQQPELEVAPQILIYYLPVIRVWITACDVPSNFDNEERTEIRSCHQRPKSKSPRHQRATYLRA
jgi:hypothetical protein